MAKESFCWVKSYSCSNEEECETPKQRGIQSMICPSPPRKRRAELKSQDPPPGGYFNPPELEILFANIGRRRAPDA